MPITTAYSFGDVVLVPFSFTDQTASKKRPAVVVSAEAYQQRRPDVIVMAVTSQIRRGPASWRGTGKRLARRRTTKGHCRIRLGGVRMIVMRSLSRPHFGVHLLILLLGAWTTGLQANPPQSASNDEELLSRVGKYVQELEDHLALVIGDETYHQDVWTKGWRGDQHTASRAIRSETLFMSLTQDGTWLSVRNVLSADGRSIQDSKGRLDRILKAPGLDYLSQLRLLKAESARFDIGQVWRTTGDPTMVFRFFACESKPVYVRQTAPRKDRRNRRCQGCLRRT
jgi:mRNA-degrading endonuclease toxin of MazEF toxin-antitoxin module